MGKRAFRLREQHRWRFRGEFTFIELGKGQHVVRLMIKEQSHET